MTAAGFYGADTCSLSFRPMDEPAARAMMAWRYPPPYDFYDILPPPGEEETLVAFFADPRNRYYAIEDAEVSGELVAFCCFGHDAQVPSGSYGDAALDIGLGLRPSLCGRGRGGPLVDAVLTFAQQEFAPPALRTTVAAFNARALRVWQRAGFTPVQSFSSANDGTPFVVLTRQPLGLAGQDASLTDPRADG